MLPLRSNQSLRNNTFACLKGNQECRLYSPMLLTHQRQGLLTDPCVTPCVTGTWALIGEAGRQIIQSSNSMGGGQNFIPIPAKI